MNAVWLTCLLLCTYGFFKELRPSEPFFTDYLIGPPQNLTEAQVYYDVYPVWTYSYLSLLIIVFLVTDFFRYKPVIVFEGFGYVATWALLLWARGVKWMQFMEFCYGIATSTEVAYYTYIYAKVPQEAYQKVTSFTRAAILIGRFVSGVLSQVLTSTGVMDYHSLNYISFTCMCLAFLIACFIPSVTTSIYFHRQQGIVTSGEESSRMLYKAKDCGTKGKRPSWKQVLRYIKSDFVSAYTNSHLLKWSIWWAFATCGNFQIGNYIQPLWQTIAPTKETDTIWNGAVEATQTLLSAIAALSIGFVHLNWALLGELTLAIISLLDGVVLSYMGVTSEIWVAYVNYIIFRVSYQVLITIASYQVARELRADSYGLVFGINMFLSLFLQTVLTVVVVDILQTPIRIQFLIYGAYFCILAVLFFVLAGFHLCQLGCIGIRNTGLWEMKPVIEH
ncbi:thiamine transporter 1-like [Oratosquilla oratoria]|uniref:thiamine transporter 1-like n=1 Tax=Oratosquilla oratoria TaxID=337810 RepID=UPI003F7705DC